jgi:hypothetical protein
LVVPAVATTTTFSSPANASASAEGTILSASQAITTGAGIPSSHAARATL